MNRQRRRTDRGTWSGWRMTPSGLYSPEGTMWTPPTLNRWHWDRQRLAELERLTQAPAQFLLDW